MDHLNAQDMDIVQAMSRAAANAGREAAADKIEQHERCYHQLPAPNHEALSAVPFAQDRIPDMVLAEMVEQIEVEGIDLAEVAQRHGQPLSLVKRELAAFGQRYDRWIADFARRSAVFFLSLGTLALCNEIVQAL